MSDTFVIALTKERIVGAKVKDKSKIADAVEYGWDKTTLDIVLSKLKDHFKFTKVRILLGDDLSYVVRLTLPDEIDKEGAREYIKNQIQDKIPEALEEGDWDFKELDFKAGGEDQKGSERQVIVFSPVKDVFSKLSEALNRIEIEVEAVEAEVVAKTRNLNPIIGITLKEDISGKDEEVLNLRPLSQSPETGKDEKMDLRDDAKVESQEKSKLTFTTYFLMIVTLLSVVGAGVFFYLRSVSSNKVEDQVSLTLTPTSMPTPTISEEVGIAASEADLAAFKIQVQNGSGVAGAATNLAEKLKEEGYVNVDIGNASASNLGETQILKKDAFPEVNYQSLVDILGEEYKVATESGKLLENDDYEVIIILGRL